MKDYHLFQEEQKNILYLSNFKQAFLIPKEDYILIQNKQDNNIIEKYAAKVNTIDRKDEIKGEDSVYELYLCVANLCNARCKYCFANQGDYGKSQGIMKTETARKAIDFFMWKVPETCEARIIFFGGEPLLAYDVMIQTCKYVKEKYPNRVSTFYITTNATLLTKEMIDCMSFFDFRVAISLDGGPQIQNSQRPLANEADSYVEATKNIGYLMEKIKHVLIRGTYCCDHGYDLDKCYEDLSKLHINEINIVPDISGIKDDETCKKLLHQLDRLHRYMLNYVKTKNDFPFGLFIIKIRELFLRKTVPAYRCGAGKNTFSVDITGNIYPCHRLSADAELKLGNVEEYHSSSEWNINLYKASCSVCWNRYTCTHGCRYEDKIAQGKYENEKGNPFFCAYSKKMTEIAILLCIELPSELLKKILGIRE